MNAKIKLLALIVSMAFALTGCLGDEGDDGLDGAPGPAGPAGPQGPGGADGADGQDGTGGGASILKVGDTITAQANDLRGLTYARVAPNAGKIYASGHVGTTNETRQVVVARFNADGTPDTTFDTDGFAQLQATPAVFANGDENSLGIAELQSGDVVVTVNAADAGGGQSIYMFRLTPAGALRAGWGDADGKVEVAFGWPNAQNGAFPGAPAAIPSDTAWDVQVDRSIAGDRVAVFGFGSAAPNAATRTDNDRYVARLNITATSAVTDPGFNGGSAFTYHSTGTLADNSRRGSVEADGKIVSAGYANLTGGGNHVILFRLNASGTLDTTFGGFSTSTDLLPAQAGVAVFNPFRVDGGAAECYAVGRQTSGSYVTTGYGAATAAATPSTLGYQTTLAQDLVTFRALGGVAANVDTGWANGGHQAIQSEGKGFPSNEERGRHLVVLPDDRVIQVGRFGGNPAAYVLTEDGDPDESVFGDGIIELPHATVNSQFFAVALSPDGNRVAMSTDNNANGARLVVLKVASN